MKNTLLTFLSALSLVSCASGPNAQTGSVIGALAGAGIGGIIGSQSHRGLQGAAIGGALGAMGGNALVNARDQRNAGYGGPPQQQGYYDNQGRWIQGGPPPQQGYYNQGGPQQQGYYRNY